MPTGPRPAILLSSLRRQGYDTASRLLSLDNQTANGHHKYDYTYDDVGNRLGMTVTNNSGMGVHVYSYDEIYQLTGVTYPSSFDPNLATNTTFAYDAAGNRTSVIDGSGTCTYTTNSLNEYTAAGSVSYQYDASGNLVHDQNYAYGYDPENRLVMVHQSGSLPPVSLNQALESPLTYTTGGDAPWQVSQTNGHGDYDCAYSGSLGADQSNYLETTVTGPGTFSFWWKSPSSDTGSALYFYLDGTARSSLPGDQETWEQRTYTITGSGTHTLRWTFSRSSDENHSGTGYVDSVQWTGSAAPAPEPPASYWHRLTYTYDPSGRRIAKSYNEEVITSYVYDGDHCLAEYDLNGNLKRKYIYGPGVDQPICMIEAGSSYAGTYYYHFDGLGSVVALTSGNAGSMGNTVEVYEYDVYGRVGALDADHPNRFMFTGREFDKETGLYYYRARYYNPQIGRFLQTDPIGYGDGTNWYAYCANNGVNATDPFGFAKKTFWDLPFNHGTRIAVKVAFYNGGAPGFYIDEGNRVDNTSGGQFHEAADDFSVTFEGETYYLGIDMNVGNPYTLIDACLGSLDLRGFDVTDIYFFDHSAVGTDGKTIEALDFGENPDNSKKVSDIKKEGKSLYWDRVLPKNCTVNFRQCEVGSETNRDLLATLAVWMNRTVTGGTDYTTFDGPKDYDPTWTHDGTGYAYGDLWGAKPGGTPYVIWTKYRPVTLWETLTKGWTGTVLNEVPRPY